MRGLALLVAVGCGHPGVCEVRDGAGGTLCYERGESRHRCQGFQDGGDWHWTDDVVCADLGYQELCTEDHQYTIYGDDPQTCCRFDATCGAGASR